MNAPLSPAIQNLQIGDTLSIVDFGDGKVAGFFGVMNGDRRRLFLQIEMELPAGRLQ